MTGLFGQAFFQHAFIAGTAIALAAGLAGYFLVLRAQVFATDALGHVAYTGAMGALAFGASPTVGLFAGTVAVGALLAGLGRRARADDVVIGSVFAWVLGLGVLFLSLYTLRGSANGTASVSYLFGSIFGLSTGATVWAVLVAGAATLLLLTMARPLLFASLDEPVAAARGVRVRLLGVAFLVVVAVVTAESTLAVGALLVLGLVSAPAGAAHRLTARPYVGLALSAGLAVASMWVGLVLSGLVPQLPPSFAVIAVAATGYLASVLGTRHVAMKATATAAALSAAS